MTLDISPISCKSMICGYLHEIGDDMTKLSKRTHLPFREEVICPSCGVEIDVNLEGEHHLSYPSIGEVCPLYLMCVKCGAEIELGYRVEVTVTRDYGPRLQ